MSFDDERWKLHTALAWIMTRDREFTERCLALSYYPCLTIGEFPPASDVNESWKLLFGALSDGRIPVFGHPTEIWKSAEVQLSSNHLRGLDWANPSEFEGSEFMPGLRRREAMKFRSDKEFAIPEGIAFRYVTVSSSAVIREFPVQQTAIGFTSGEYGPPELPDGGGYMRLTSAAYWIATEGGKRSFFLRDNAVWSKSFKELLDQIIDGQVEVIGRPKNASFQERLDGIRLSSILIQFTLDDPRTIESSDQFPVLECSYPRTASQTGALSYRLAWPLMGDHLRVRDRIQFSELEVKKDHIRRIWNFNSQPGVRDECEAPTATIRQSREQAYARWVSDHAGFRPPTTKDDVKYMKNLFPKMSRDEVRGLRELHAPPEWKQKGRRLASLTPMPKATKAAPTTPISTPL